MIRKALLCLFGTTLMTLAAAPAMAEPLVAWQGEFPGDYVAPATVGKGKHTHQFVLRDPLTGKPMPRARYHLALPEHKIAGLPESLDGRLFGITDKQGRTATVRLPSRHAPAEWTLEPVMGTGDFGVSFALQDADEERLGKKAYVLDVNGGYVMCGQSDSRGNTWFVRSHQAAFVSAHTEVAISDKDFAWCKRSAETIAGLPTDAQAPAVFKALLAQYESSKAELSEDLLKIIEQKLVRLAVAGRDSKQLDTAIAHAGTFDFNQVGYDMVDANWMVERGLTYIEKALAADPDEPHALDSKGWALYRLGKGEQALPWLDRSMAAFGEATEENQYPRTETLTHKGEVLWTLGRKEEARKAFMAARDLDSDAAILKETLERLEVELDHEGHDHTDGDTVIVVPEKED